MLAIARAKRITPRKLFSPFWRSMSVGVVGQVRSKPQILQSICVMTGTEPADFLRATMCYTLPYMTFMRKHDVLERLRQATPSEREGGETLLQVLISNMSIIIGVLLVQETGEFEKSVMKCFQDVCDEMKNSEFNSIIRSNPISIATEVLKCCGDDDQVRKARVSI